MSNYWFLGTSGSAVVSAGADNVLDAHYFYPGTPRVWWVGLAVSVGRRGDDASKPNHRFAFP